ncbi:hypothetical protein DVV81_04895 [Clostridium botulinum]|uniref:hypothetical protein n=1 Tax=Clostridium botulinum TaxID=1491 RepID=UPI001967CB69|nr:hypothetical protein [Clostridium botulinum]MBN1070510.1 hypothetical protein [Clostridium botulinum]
MKKKIISALLCGLVVFSFMGCGSNSTQSNTSKENPVKTEVEKPKEEKKQPPVTIEQLPLNITIGQPDSIGNVYMNATYTNNSEKNITGFNLNVLLKDSNEKTYLSTYDTVLPGEASPAFNSFGPKTLNMDDIEILKYEITITNADGSKTYLNYDNKLKQYSWN